MSSVQPDSVQPDVVQELLDAMLAAAAEDIMLEGTAETVQSFGSEARTGAAMLGLGDRFLSILDRVLKNIDLSKMTKDQFLAAVGMAYDVLVPSSLPFMKQLVLLMAGRLYDRLTQPK
jgi:hypothetical protein